MRLSTLAGLSLAALALTACGGQPADAQSGGGQSAAASTESAPAQAEGASDVDLAVAKSGLYTTDLKHRHILFNYLHQGLSMSWVRWRDWDGELNWNAEDPEASSVAITINAESVDSGVDEFDGHLRDANFFDTANHPEITFESTALESTGATTGRMTGDLTIKGVTKPVTLDVTLNQTMHNAEQGLYKVGFSAKGVVKRSDYGLDAYVPFVGDDVNVVIETEWQMTEGGE